MNRTTSVALVCTILMMLNFTSTLGRGADVNAPRLQVAFDAGGVKSLTFNQVELLANGKLAVTKALFKKADASTTTINAAPTFTFDPAKGRALATAAWGTVECVYTPQADRLDMRVVVTNKSPDTLTELWLSPLELKLPAAPTVAKLYVDFFGRIGATSSYHNEGAPTILPADFGTGLVVLCNDEVNRPLTLSLDLRSQAARVDLHAGGDRMEYDEVYLRRPVGPGQTDTYTISLRFAPGGTNPLAVADDVCKAYGKAYPLTLKWPDRRPITRIFFGPGLAKETVLANCRDPEKAKLPTEADPKFRKNMQTKFQGAIAVAKATGAQGIIMWSLEGETFPHATTYIGDPRCMKWLNPQMDLVADEMIQMIRDANLRPGVCLRPSRVIYVRNEDPKLDTVKHSYGDAKDPFLELDAKIEYCKKRWGCSLFYVDTNVFWRARGPEGKFSEGHISADTWRRLSEKHPDVLLIPELGYTQIHASTAPYSELDMGARETPEMIHRIWPDAFSIRQLEDDDPIADHDLLVRITQAGGVIMANSGLGRFSVGISEARHEAQVLDQGVPAAVKQAQGDLTKLLAAAGESDLVTRYYAATALGQLKAPAATEKLLALLADEQWLVRKAAVVALGELAAPSAAGPLGKLMADPNAYLDWIAAGAMRKIGSPAVPALIAVVQAAPRRAAPAITILGDLAAPEAVEPLTVVATDPKAEWQAGTSSLSALAKIGTAPAIDAVLKTLQSSPNEGFRAAAAKALGTVKDPRAATALQEALTREKQAEKPNKDMIDILNASLTRLQKAAKP